MSTYGWSSLYKEISVKAAVNRLIVVVTQAMGLAAPCGHSKEHKHPAWSSGKLKRIIFIDVTRGITLDCFIKTPYAS
jgi:hypothetical protein